MRLNKRLDLDGGPDVEVSLVDLETLINTARKLGAPDGAYVTTVDPLRRFSPSLAIAWTEEVE